MPSSFTYLDYAASAPLSDVARAAQQAYEEAPYAGANPNSLHTMGRQAARALDAARRDLVRCLGGGFRPTDITFTSGGTESNNLALLGLAEGMRAQDRVRTKVILSAIEHDSVLDVAPVLKARGFEVVEAAPDRSGVVEAASVEPLLGRDVALVSIMSANNETGAIQPVGEVARLAHKAGALMRGGRACLSAARAHSPPELWRWAGAGQACRPTGRLWCPGLCRGSYRLRGAS